MPTDPPAAKENTYILDTEGAAEMARLTQQDRLLTKGMGGLFPERDDIAGMNAILDIACGPGGWVLDVAYTYAKIEVVGIDINRSMIEYARAQAHVQGLDNARFQVMDALQPLDFPDDSFDLVNARFLVAFMPRTAWPRFLQECLRITKPGGTIRLTEFDEPGRTNSLAFEDWCTVLSCHTNGWNDFRSRWKKFWHYTPAGPPPARRRLPGHQAEGSCHRFLLWNGSLCKHV